MQTNSPFILTSQRLELPPLSPHALRLWIDDLPGLEKLYLATYSGETIDNTFKNILANQHASIPSFDETLPYEYAWYTFWLIIKTTQTREIIGSFDLKHGIDPQGLIKIGYGLGQTHQHCGYMTEAIQRFIAWAFEDTRLKGITAETEWHNTASQNVLKHCGFKLMAHKETLWWRLRRATSAPNSEFGTMALKRQIRNGGAKAPNSEFGMRNSEWWR